MRIQRYLMTIVVGMAAVLVLGCREEGVRRYQVPRAETPAEKAVARLPDDLNYTIPEGWKKRGADPKGFYVAAFQVTDDTATADITITPLEGQGGGVTANVNYWRTQNLKMDPLDEQQIRQILHEITVDGKQAQYVDLSGPESAGAQRPRLLGVIAARGEKTWFFKMIGPADLVDKQKPAFEAFVKSVTLGESTGNKDG